MLHRLVSSTRALWLLAAVTLVVPTAVLGLYGMFQDWSTAGGPSFSWGMAAWLGAPYVAFAALLVWAGLSTRLGFRVAVAVTAVVVIVQSVVIDVITLSSDEDLAAVGVLMMPVLYLGGAVVLAVVGLVLHLAGTRRPVTGARSGLTEPGHSAL